MNRQTWREILILLVLATLLGFGYSYVTKHGFFSQTPVTTEQPNLKVVSLQDAKAAFDAHTATFIDARHEFEYTEGHIRGAISIPLNHLDEHAYLIDRLKKETRLIVYCDGVACNSSIELATKLLEHGFFHVELFYGGWQEWTDARFPIEQSEHHSQNGTTKQ
jgi:rhodanese-related sulfurtransferase